jgi:hypothetical protein
MTPATVLSIAGLVVIAVCAVRLRQPRAGLPMMLELWTAAALLHLTADPEWRSLLAAASVIAVRTLVLARRGRSSTQRPLTAR